MKLSKKNKTLLSSSVGLLAATSVVAPLATMTSCSNQESVVEELADKEFGITEETYNDLKNQFTSKYKANLIIEFGDESPETTKYLGKLENELESFDQVRKQKKCGFTSLTSSLVDFAKNQSDARGKKYNIKLDRKSNATWAQIDVLFNSWKGSFRQYMLNSDMPAATITRVMQDAQNRFIVLKKELQQTCNDATDGLITAKTRLITCFEGVNRDIGLISASIQLKEFMSQYIIESKTLDDDNFDASCLDNITDPKNEYYAPDFVVGSVLSDKTMNQIFKITRKSDGENVAFSSSLIKGYTLFPRVMSINRDKIANNYSVDMDFGLVKTSYLGAGKNVDDLTAHLYAPNDDISNDDLIDGKVSVADTLKKADILVSNYVLHLTKETELVTLKEIYFEGEDQKIHFMWDNDNAKNQALEAFYDNATQDPQNSAIWHGALSMQSLTNSHIMISSTGNEKSKHKFVSALSSSIQETVANNKKLDYYDLSQQFINNCVISSKTTINENDKNQTTTVKNELYAKYKNSIYRDGDGLKLNAESYQTECVNHATSEEFYARINRKFNDVIHYVSFYDPTILNNNSKTNDTEEEKQDYLYDLYIESSIQLFVSCVALSVAAITLGYLIYQIAAPWKRASTSTTYKVVSLILVIILTSLQATTFALFVKFYYEPIQKMFSSKEIIKEEIKSSEVISYLDLNLQKNYSLIDDETDELIDKEDFYNKKKNFDNHEGGMAWKLSEYRKYSNPIMIKGMTQFNQLLTTQEIDSESFHTKLDDWKEGGKYWLTSFVLSIVTAVVTLCLLAWSKNMEKKYQDKLQKAQEQADLDALQPILNNGTPEDLCDKGKYTQVQWVDSCSKSIKKRLGQLYNVVQDKIGLPGWESLAEICFKRVYEQLYDDIKMHGGDKLPSQETIKKNIGWKTNKCDSDIWHNWSWQTFFYK